jgi:hypothetical protein
VEDPPEPEEVCTELEDIDSDNQQSFQEGGSSSSTASSPHRMWNSWSEMPEMPPDWLRSRYVFLEIFCGNGGITKEIENLGVFVLPAVDITIGGVVIEKTDILDPSVRRKIRKWISSGVIDLVHFGTPCTTYSSARR